MLAKRIIPCLDVKEGKVVKGTQFRQHRIVGNIEDLAKNYSNQGADELVFYDITASCEDRTVSTDWIDRVANLIDIPFCVAGGIDSLEKAERILSAGADKVSVNSPAIRDPNLIDRLARRFGSQCVVVGVDSIQTDSEYQVCQFTGDEKKSRATNLTTKDWIKQATERGAGEIVLNCMNQDGKRSGYDTRQLAETRRYCTVPLIASGGAGVQGDFLDVFEQCDVDGALAASVFHLGEIKIQSLKSFLNSKKIPVRL